MWKKISLFTSSSTSSHTTLSMSTKSQFTLYKSYKSALNQRLSYTWTIYENSTCLNPECLTISWYETSYSPLFSSFHSRSPPWTWLISKLLLVWGLRRRLKVYQYSRNSFQRDFERSDSRKPVTECRNIVHYSVLKGW